MSYPVRRCPYCQREMPESDVEQAIQKEIQIWRPWDSPYPDTTSYPQDSTTWPGTGVSYKIEVR